MSLLAHEKSLPISIRVGRKGIHDSQKLLVLAQLDVKLLAREQHTAQLTRTRASGAENLLRDL